MQRRRPVGKWIALCCGGLAALAVVLALAGYGVVSAVGGRRAQRALARVKASGAPTKWEEVIPPPVPDAENAAVMYERGTACVVLPSDPWAQVPLYHYAFGERPKRAKVENQVAAMLSVNALALDYAARGATRRKCRFDVDWRTPLSLSLSWPADRLRRLSVLVLAEAMFRADQGDAPGALREWSVDLAMARGLGMSPTLIGQLTFYTYLDSAESSLRVLLQDARPNPEDCRRLERELAGLDVNRAFLKALEVERVIDLKWVDLARSDYAATAMPPASGRGPARLWEKSKRLALDGKYVFLSPLDRAAVLQYWDQAIPLGRKPYRQIVGKMTGLVNLVRQIPDYAWVAQTKGAAPDLLEMEARVRDWAIARLTLMRTALGLAAYRTQYGAYPASLGQLRRTMRWEVPQDPFSGRDLIYHREGAGYRLYSLGMDLQDNGGRDLGIPPYDPRRPPGRDIVWRVER